MRMTLSSESHPMGRWKEARPSGGAMWIPITAATLLVSLLESPKLNSTTPSQKSTSSEHSVPDPRSHQIEEAAHLDAESLMSRITLQRLPPGGDPVCAQPSPASPTSPIHGLARDAVAASHLSATATPHPAAGSAGVDRGCSELLWFGGAPEELPTRHAEEGGR